MAVSQVTQFARDLVLNAAAKAAAVNGHNYILKDTNLHFSGLRLETRWNYKTAPINGDIE
jgi:hypothetical protein